MAKAQIMKEWPPNGFKLVKEFEGLPWQHLLFFGRDENWKPSPAKQELQKATKKTTGKRVLFSLLSLLPFVHFLSSFAYCLHTLSNTHRSATIG